MRKKLDPLELSGEPKAESAPSTFMEDVCYGLGNHGQKTLPPKYFYDALGTALFDAITLLPEYGLTRADTRLLRKYSRALVDGLDKPSVVAELGSGTGGKTRWVLEAFGERAVTYCPIDVSATALERCKAELAKIGAVRIVPLEESYLDGLRRAAALRLRGTSMLVLFLGSSIGNFDPEAAEELCRGVRSVLHPGDVFYLSTDLEKAVDPMILAYDDPLGVTAAFNLNVLARINRELGGNFDLSRFSHAVRYDRNARRIEMHLKSTVNQMTSVGSSLRLSFREGETIWTESSYKFRPEEVRSLALRCGFDCESQWIDDEWPFAQSLLRAQ